jgi:hypothetical protein
MGVFRCRIQHIPLSTKMSKRFWLKVTISFRKIVAC